jgi:hypothetical protein
MEDGMKTWFTPAADSAVQATLLDYGVANRSKDGAPLIRLVINDRTDPHPYAYFWDDMRTEYYQVSLPEFEMTLEEMKSWAVTYLRMM